MNTSLSLVTPPAAAESSTHLETHSALPWKTCRMSGIVRIENVSRLQHVAVLPNTGPNTIKDAVAIVKAVNHHDALVNALDKMMKALDPTTPEQSAAWTQGADLLAALRRA